MREDELAAKILRAKKLYYAGVPELSDQEYDALEDELRDLNPGHDALQQVGYEMAEVGKGADEDKIQALYKHWRGLLKTYTRMKKAGVAKKHLDFVGESIRMIDRWITQEEK